MSGTVLLVSNRRTKDSGGRAEKVATRKRLLREHGWEVVVAHAPEPYVSGFPSALTRCVRTGRRERVDAIVSINNPFHLHVLGYLTSRVLQKPWLAELRDPISTHPDRDPNSPITWTAKAVERLVVREADRVVWFDGIQLLDEYFERYDIPNERIVKLPPMGYEKAKFDAADRIEYETFTITYAGSFYEGWIEPYTFIDGLGRYIQRTGRRDLRVQFYGDWSADYQDAVERAAVADVVERHDFVPHEEIVPVLKGSDVLLYIGGGDSGNRLNLPSKLWDYVGAKRPILAVVDPSFRVAGFVESHDLGLIADTDDPRTVAEALIEFRDDYDFTPDASVFEEYTRERSAERIAAVLNDITQQRHDQS
jgi:glycosyltransferase involved in cell wall biosynthesis